MKQCRLFLILILFLLPLLSACGGHDSDRAELERIDSLASSRQPVRALELLDSIDARSLSEPNRNLYDLLRIKARDKNFQTHRSNETILRLVAYYRDHQSEGRYPEALYYAGRVHSDLGDLPSALKFFYQSLDQLNEGEEDIHLKAVVNSQIGNHLNRMRLYDKAIPYLINTVKLTNNIRDSIGIVYTEISLGSAFLHINDFKNAEIYFHHAHKIAKKLNKDPLIARAEMYLARVEFEHDSISKALKLIRTVPERINEGAFDVALAFAAEIYKKAGTKDTAFYYANKIKDMNCVSQKLGWQLLLQDLTDQIDPDSIVPYLKKYTQVMEGFVSKNADEAALLQHSLYNYSVLERERDKTTKKIKILNWVFAGLVFLLLGFLDCIYFLFVENRKWKENTLALIEKTDKLKKALYAPIEGSANENKEAESESLADARAQLIQLLSDSIKNYHRDPEKERKIRDSDVYGVISELLNTNSGIPDVSPIWGELEKQVLSVYPDFKNRFTLLTLGEEKVNEYRLALLTKSGFGPKDVSRLMHVTPQTISYRKKIFCKDLFSDQIDIADFQNAIGLI